MKPPSRARSGRSAASARASRSTSAKCSPRSRAAALEERRKDRVPLPARAGSRSRPACRGAKRGRAGRRAPGRAAPWRAPYRRCGAKYRAEFGAAAPRRAGTRPRRAAWRSRRHRSAALRAVPRGGARPAPVTVRSMIASRLPLRSPCSVSASSRLRRVAASISMKAPVARRCGGRSSGTLPCCVSST